MADVIGRAIIEVAPDVSRFARQVTRDLNKAFRNFKKVSVGISVGSIRKAFVEVSKLNTAVRATVLGFTLLAGKSIAAGLISAAQAATELSGALLVVPAAGAAAALAMGTLAVGLHGLDDLFKALVKRDMDKFNEALEELSPAAQKSLQVLKKFLPEIEKFRDAVQDALLGKLGPSIERVFLALLPRVQRAFVGIATEINHATQNFAKFITQAQTLRDFDTVAINTVNSLRLLSPSLNALAQVIRDIVTVGSEFLPRLMGELTLGALKLRDFVSQARESGALGDFIATGIGKLHQLIDIIGNVGRALVNLTSIADAAGFGLLDGIQNITAEFARFTGSLEGRRDLTNFFISAHKAVEALMPVLSALFSLFATHIAPILAQFATIVGPSIVVFVTALGRAFDAARPGIEAFAAGVGKFLEGIAPALPIIGELAGVIGELLGKALQRIAPILEKFIELVAKAFIDLLSDPEFVDSLMDLIDAVGEFLIALVPILPVLAELVKVLLPFFAQVLRILTPLLRPLIDLLKAVVGVLPPLLFIVQALLIPLTGLAIALAKVLEVLFRVPDVVGQAIDLFGVLTDVVFGFDNKTGQFKGGRFTEILDQFASTLGAAGSAAGIFAGQVTGSLKAVGDAVTFEMGRAGSALEAFDAPLGEAGNAALGFGGLIGSVFNQAVTVVETALGRIGAAVTASIEPIGQAGVAAGVSYAGGLSGALGQAVGAARQVAENVIGIFGGDTGRYAAAGSAVGRAFAGGISASISAAVAAAHSLAAAVARVFPGSPAKEGPFSGRGWTPFRGRALSEGFAEGITSGQHAVATASRSLVGLTAADLTRFTSVNGAVNPFTPRQVQPTAATNSGPLNVVANVRVFVDGTELRVIAADVVAERDRALRRQVTSGVGGGR